MGFLQEIFEQGALTYDQLAEKLQTAGADGKPAKLVDLTQGGYVGISIIENVSDAGVDMPPFLLPVVNWVQSRAEKEAGGEDETPPAGE